MASTSTYTHINAQADVCGGLPCIKGTRIRVIDVVALYRRGLTPAEILDSYDHLTLGQVHAALAFYYDHKDDVDAQFLRCHQLEEQIRRDSPAVVR